jgi:hypothetical protein
MESTSSYQCGEEDIIVIWLCQSFFTHFLIFSHLLPLEGGGAIVSLPFRGRGRVGAGYIPAEIE